MVGGCLIWSLCFRVCRGFYGIVFVVSGDGGRWLVSCECLAGLRCHGGARRVASGARARGRRWGGACPVRAHGVSTRDASGIPA